MISINEVARVCSSKAELYELMLRNEYVMPSLHSQIVSIEFMFNVKSGQIYCPKIEDISGQKFCPKPPSKSELLEAIDRQVEFNIQLFISETERQQIIALHDLLKVKDCDKKWLLSVLWALNNEDPVFAKDYYYSRAKSS